MSHRFPCSSNPSQKQAPQQGHWAHQYGRDSVLESLYDITVEGESCRAGARGCCNCCNAGRHASCSKSLPLALSPRRLSRQSGRISSRPCCIDSRLYCRIQITYGQKRTFRNDSLSVLINRDRFTTVFDKVASSKNTADELRHPTH